MRRPTIVSSAGSRVSAAIIVNSTASAAAACNSIKEVEAEQEHPQQRDDHRDPREEDGTAGGINGFDRCLPGLEVFVETVQEAG